MSLDTFDPIEYQVTNDFLVADDLWIELDGREGVPVSINLKFYHPAKPIRSDWVEYLSAVKGIHENVYFDPEVVSLPSRITPGMIDAALEQRGAFVRDNMTQPKGGPPDRITKDFTTQLSPEEYIRSLQINLNFSGRARDREKLTPFERKVLVWSEVYGILSDTRRSTETESSATNSAKLYRVDREYYFHLNEYPHLIISLAQENSSGRPIWGLRRSLALDWPFDDPRKDHKPDDTYRVVSNLNRMMIGIERLLEPSS